MSSTRSVHSFMIHRYSCASSHKTFWDLSREISTGLFTWKVFSPLERRFFDRTLRSRFLSRVNTKYWIHEDWCIWNIRTLNTWFTPASLPSDHSHVISGVLPPQRVTLAFVGPIICTRRLLGLSITTTTSWGTSTPSTTAEKVVSSVSN